MNTTLLSNVSCASPPRSRAINSKLSYSKSINSKSINPNLFNVRPKFMRLARRTRTTATEITSREEFDKKVLQAKIPTVVIFSAPWCIHSVTMKPRMHRLAAEFDGHAYVYQVDADTNSWTREFVKTFPTIVNFRAGKEVFRTSGTVDYSVIKCNLQMELRRRSF